MWKKLIVAVSTLSFAFAILIFSLFRTASVQYSFNPINPEDAHILGQDNQIVDYYLPYPGNVLPDSQLWNLKALRDKLWLAVTASPTREAELNLLFADKRIVSAVLLFEKGDTGMGLTTLSKAEKYLEQAQILEEKNRLAGFETSDFLYKVSLSSLKHFELIQYIQSISPDDAKPSINEVSSYPMKVYEKTRNALLDRKMTPPENPFNW